MVQRGSCGGEAKSFSANQRSTDAATELSEKLGVTSEGKGPIMTNGMNVSRRDLFKFGGLAAITAAGAGALAGCAPQQKMASTGAAAAEDGSTYVGPSFLQKPAEITEFDEEHTYDVVVVGAGESGLSAMHAALEAGATVGALQSLSIVQTAGNMGASIDLTKTNEAGIKAVLSFINYKSDYRANLGQVETWARNSQEALAWWAEAAAKGGSESKPYDYTVNCNGHEVFFHANTYFHDEGHQKGALVIGDAVQAEGAEIFFETPCVQLLVEDGRVAGAIGETKDGTHVLLRASKGVIMAAGDYVGDSEMLYYYTPDAKGLHQAVDFRNGTGLKAAMWAGAQMCPASHTKMVHGEGPKVRFEMPYLFLDRHGKRFMDEGCCRMGYLNEFTNKYLAEVDFAESTAAKFFSIVPTNWEEHYDAWKDFSDISIHNAYRNVDPEAWIKGDTLEELAEGMIAYADEEGWAHDYTVEAIVESINRYNELVAAGNGDEDFGKRDEYMVPIEAPCYAVPRGANNIDALVDGLRCDGNFQCLDVDMRPIEGLFAVGNASGPFFGNSNYPMDIEGLSVGRAITSGFATGRYVAGL